ncbi:uncharacterized protein K489DRAFT_301731, partial [Dissoconium aciculare CBS 342.82]|uniref:Uncharacterized protein n=1 Tax=Dissoconium aciculare CBS 342.82 TaxID=1314786 RepID=A0A6J3MIU6_9PEZI
HYNTFQTSCSPSNDVPPTYANAVRARLPSPRPRSDRRDPLPAYTCTVDYEARMLLRVESHSPLHDISEADWKEVILVLRGTSLVLHRARKDGSAGKALRTYTLQHAEVGLASDTQYSILVPQSRLAHFLPAAAWRKAWRTDPSLFKSVEQSLLRLRVEADQILLAHAEEETVHGLVHALAAAIDISMDLDERSIPRQCTVPRRRNRQSRTLEAVAGILENPAILAQQERILRELYPQLAGQASETDRAQSGSVPATADEADSPLATLDPSASRRPSVFRQTTTSTIDSTFSVETIHASPSTNFGADGKWRPPHNRSPAQIERYIKRCMPVLPADAPRASDVLVHAGRRVKINWKTGALDDWALPPPSYRSHRF